MIKKCKHEFRQNFVRDYSGAKIISLPEGYYCIYCLKFGYKLEDFDK